MSRTFDAIDLVALPRLSAAEAIALASALVSRAHALAPLPMAIGRSLGRLEGALDALRQAVRMRMGDGDDKGVVIQVVDRVLDSAWTSSYVWCNSWRRLPGQPDINAKAERLHSVLYANGLPVTERQHKVQWLESQARLDLIEEYDLEPVFRELGGQVILDTIRSAHNRYGQLLGLIEAGARPALTVGERLRALVETLRRYVIRAAAHVEPDDPASVELACGLLEPLEDLQIRLESDALREASERKPATRAPARAKPSARNRVDGPGDGPVVQVSAPLSSDLTLPISEPSADSSGDGDDDRTLQ